MDWITIVVVLLSALTLSHGYRVLYSTWVKKHPPGPTPLPIIGNIHLLGNQPHKSLAKLAKTHGPLMRLRLGFINTVVISSSAMAKEVLQKQDLAFSSRWAPDALHACDHSNYSVVWLPVAARWRSLRKVLTSNIFSGSRLDANQHLSSRKVQELIAYCGSSSQTGEAVDVGRAAFRTSLNLLSNTIFSVDLADPFSDSGKEFKDLVCNIMVEAGKPNLVDYFPFLEKIDPQGIRRRMTFHFEKVIELFSCLIAERLEKGESKDSETNDVIDVLLATSKENPEEMDRTHIERLCLDMFVAGTDTTSNTLEWAMTEAIRNPEIMKKAKSELEEIVGKGKIISEEEVQRLPYLRCMVKETLRIHPPVPFLIPRKVEEDVQVCGYTVPRNSQILVNAWAIGRDGDAWKNPLEFKPERFLGSEIDVRGRDFELIPFGAGRRICPGLPLAIRMVPVILGSLLNSFDWKLEGGSSPDEVDVEEKFGITLQKAIPLRAVPIPL
ncbi:geraniol 8-hydroxylase-like [Dorcoceras hygrometricum]|uniref:Geraniol 8-hydroxylase-like n=1 Tax=Dorcoceras hygrometricum TaxID=472368 RepID=A0A2Z7D7W4_9LAMI|nr:geraniol 8-hydroxylase-like [Dorcoceras hygrometricum]